MEWDTRYRIVHPALVSAYGYLRNLASLAEVERKLLRARRTTLMFVVNSALFAIGLVLFCVGLLVVGPAVSPYMFFWSGAYFVIGGLILFAVAGGYWSIATAKVYWSLRKQKRRWRPREIPAQMNSTDPN